MKRLFITVKAWGSSSLGEYVAGEVKKEYDHKLVYEDDWTVVKSRIESVIEEGGKKFPRCKALKLDEYVEGEYGEEKYGRHPRLTYAKDYDSTPAFILETYVVRP